MLGGSSTGIVLREKLFELSGSAGEAETLTVFVSVPVAIGFTVTEILLTPPEPKLGIVQEIALPRLIQPGDAETKVTLLGKASVTARLDAIDGPAFVILSV